MYPIVAWFAVVFMYLHTRYLIYRLKYQKKQPEDASNDLSTGNEMNKYLSLTFIVGTIFYLPMLVLEMPRYRPFIFDSQKTKPLDESSASFTEWQDSRFEDMSRYCGPFSSNSTQSPVEEIGLIDVDARYLKVLNSLTFQLTVYCALFVYKRHKTKLLEVIQNTRIITFASK